MDAPTATSSLAHWLQWLERLSPHQIDLGLGRVRSVLARLDVARPKLLLTVGGTNGKGSTVAILDQVLRHGDRRVGAYTSPHILHYCERVTVDGAPIAEADMIAAFVAVEAARHAEPLTYFEFGTLAALVAFARAEVDVQVLEVGLGGRLDAVNATEPDGVLITNVSLDHRDWLGDNVEAIAAEKAGILRGGKPAVYGERLAPKAIVETAKALGADLRVAERDFSAVVQADGTWSWRGRDSSMSNLPMPALPGAHQVRNAAGALALLEAVGERALLSERIVASALRNLDLRGRQQTLVVGGRRWLLDGAHNAAGAVALAESLSDADGVVAVLGVLSDKDVGAIIDALRPVVSRWIACAPDSPRACEAVGLGALIAALTDQPCRVANSVADALDIAHHGGNRADLRVVAGSFYTIAEALRALEAA